MSGPHEHDDDAQGKRDEPATPEQPSTEELSQEAAPLNDAVQERLEAAEEWTPGTQWEPQTWEPETPEAIEKIEAEVASEVDAPALSEPAVAEAPGVEDIIAAAEAKAPTAVSQPDAAPGTPDEPQAPAEPDSPATQALPVFEQPDAVDEPQAPAEPESLATQALPAAAAPGAPTQPHAVVPQAAEVAEAEPEPTTAQIAAAFPSTPFGRDPRPAAAPAAQDATQAGTEPTDVAPVLIPGQTPADADMDATIIGGPLITGAPSDAVPAGTDGYGQAPLAAPARRPRGEERKAPAAPKTPVWALLLGALIAVAIIVGAILFATRPWENGQPAPSASASQDPTPTQAQGESPADVAKKFTQALIDGDATSALGLLSERTTAAQRDVSDALLDNAHYAKATDRPTAVEIDTASPAAVPAETNKTKVAATVTQAGKQVETEFTLTRTNSTSPWKVDPGMLPTVRVAGASGTTVKINGQDVKVPGTPGDYVTTGFRVLPGSYQVEGKADSFTKFGKPVKANASVTTVGAAPKPSVGKATLKPERTDKFEEEAGKAVDAWLDKCEAATETKPAKCPFEAAATFEGATITDVKWSIDVRPELAFQDYDLGIDEVVGTAGKATMTGKAKVGGEDQEIKGEVENFGFRGTLEIKDKKVVFTPVS